jgi:hypothetical protein
VDWIISLPIALAGFVFYPDVPEITRAFYLNKTVRDHCVGFLDKTQLTCERTLPWQTNEWNWKAAKKDSHIPKPN